MLQYVDIDVAWISHIKFLPPALTEFNPPSGYGSEIRDPGQHVLLCFCGLLEVEYLVDIHMESDVETVFWLRHHLSRSGVGVRYWNAEPWGDWNLKARLKVPDVRLPHSHVLVFLQTIVTAAK